MHGPMRDDMRCQPDDSAHEHAAQDHAQRSRHRGSSGWRHGVCRCGGRAPQARRKRRDATEIVLSVVDDNNGWPPPSEGPDGICIYKAIPTN